MAASRYTPELRTTTAIVLTSLGWLHGTRKFKAVILKPGTVIDVSEPEGTSN